MLIETYIEYDIVTFIYSYRMAMKCSHSKVWWTYFVIESSVVKVFKTQILVKYFNTSNLSRYSSFSQHILLQMNINIIDIFLPQFLKF